MELVNTVLQTMSSLQKPQRQFMQMLLPLLLCLRGRFNFRNLSRYSPYHEKSFSRWYRRDFDFITFNQLSLKPLMEADVTLVAVTDCSFIPKSGRHTGGLGRFYHSSTGRAEKGLEISTLALVNVTENTAYHWSTRQTMASPDEEESRVDAYLRHIQQDRASLPAQVRYLLTDGYYSKTKYLDGIEALGLYQIGKLRHDANLRWRYQGPQKERGRPRQYDGKVHLDDLSRLTWVSKRTDGTQVYTAIVNSAHFKRDLRIVYLVKHRGNTLKTALLFSTDTSIEAETLLTYYQARFQIEFLFRDAKQFLGLNDCQARSGKALNFHFNATMTALNLIKLEDREHRTGNNNVISVASWKIRKANAHLLERFSAYLGLDFNEIKSHPAFEAACHYGAIAS